MARSGSGGSVASHLVRAVAVGSGVGLAVLGGELAWVVLRDLPSFENGDASGRYEPDDAGEDQPPIVLATLGDSTLTGPGLDDIRDLWLWQALDRLGPQRPIEVRSFAVGGSRVADVRRHLDVALSSRPDLAVVAVGSNDAIHGTDLRSFRRDLERVLARLAEEVPAVAVANVGDLGNLERVPAPLSWVLRRRARAVRRSIEAVVRRQGPSVVLLDVAASDDDFRRGGVFVADRFHPNAAGHALWAMCATAGLADALAQLGVG